MYVYTCAVQAIVAEVSTIVHVHYRTVIVFRMILIVCLNYLNWKISTTVSVLP